MRMRLLLASLAFAVLPVTAAAVAAAPGASAAVTSRAAAEASNYGGSAAGNAALDWAEAHATGCWYYYGGTGCTPGYDCSGLVMQAFAAAGIMLPRTTYAMLGSSHLHAVPVSQARRGDLMFYGPGHVEIMTIWHDATFGAQTWGTRVGWHTWNAYWYPTMAFEVY